MRVAIVTPYYKETRALLERCLLSVVRQTVAADHFMIADGHPQDWITPSFGQYGYTSKGPTGPTGPHGPNPLKEHVRHIKLDRAHDDAGNTPRGIGALLAIAEGYDAVGLLDADNWLEPDHVETCLAVASPSCDYVVAKRTLRRPDESVMPLEDNWPFDTNCLFFLPQAFSVLPQWAMIPKQYAPIGDRFFHHSILVREKLRAAHTDHATVNYHNLWAASYRALGEPLPPGAKESVRV